MKVKICGINTIEEAMLCVQMGADALGFLVGITHLAEDKVDLHQAKQIIGKLPSFISSVAVTHLVDPEKVIDICKYINANTVQIHNEMAWQNVKKVKEKLPYIKIIKAFHVSKELNIDVIKNYLEHIDCILLDTRTDERLGGTGLLHDWVISKKIIETYKFPTILAGGLNPSNVVQAVTDLKLYGVDVNSGVETDNKKDKNKVELFINRAKNKL